MSLRKIDLNSIKAIFFSQIILLCILPILFIIDHFVNRIDIGSFFFAIDLGALGASVSLLKRVRENDLTFKSESKSLKIFATLMPILYGTVMSGIAYLLFMSGILSGDGGDGLLTTNLFPNFTEPSNENILDQFLSMTPIDIKDTGKLLVWCFIAGYSERFVTGVLKQLENQTINVEEK